VLVGGNGPTVLDRVLAFGDVWFPNWARGKVLERIPELGERAERAGRAIPVYIMSAPSDARELERMRDAGVERVVRWVPSAGRSVIEAALERFESAVAELNGEA
jgi:alkanesulfonate monooxygenase SsuD/methylene tetrahydromethanopterin reductase-like flavin-dependent oxidoreductase (luciferase family)